MEDVFILDALRTPIGKYAGALSGLRPDDMAAHLVRSMMDRHPELDPRYLEELVLGAANQAITDCP